MEGGTDVLRQRWQGEGLDTQRHLVRRGLGAGPVVPLLLVLHLLEAEELLALQLVQLALRSAMTIISASVGCCYQMRAS